MTIDAAMDLTNRLLAHAQALAAVTAHLRAAVESRPLDPDLQRAIDGVVDALGSRHPLEALTPQEREVVIAFARSGDRIGGSGGRVDVDRNRDSWGNRIRPAGVVHVPGSWPLLPAAPGPTAAVPVAALGAVTRTLV